MQSLSGWNKYTGILLVLITVPLVANGQDTAAAPPVAYEWEIDKYERYLRLLKTKTDSLQLVLQHRWIVGPSLGFFLMPDAVATTTDEKDIGLDMRKKKLLFGASVEYFMNRQLRWGMELALHRAPEAQKQSLGRSGRGANVDGSGGFNLPVFLYAKYMLSGLPNNKPKLYLTGGAGLIYTRLLKVEGNTARNIDTDSYMQTRLSGMAGAGLFQRLGKIVMYDLTVKYVLSSPYSPPIGSVTSYSGLQVTCKLGFIIGGQFTRIKKEP